MRCSTGEAGLLMVFALGKGLLFKCDLWLEANELLFSSIRFNWLWGDAAGLATGRCAPSGDGLVDGTPIGDGLGDGTPIGGACESVPEIVNSPSPPPSRSFHWPVQMGFAKGRTHFLMSVFPSSPIRVLFLSSASATNTGT